MELDPKLKEILSAPADPNEVPVEVMAPDEARRTWKADMAPLAGKKQPVASVEDLSLPGPAGPLAFRLYRPEAAGEKKPPLLIYLHGGGWIRGDLDTHDDVCRYLCRHGGVVVASVAYRLAPEAKFPAPVDDAYVALEWLAREAGRLGADGGRLAIGGDSAGGNIACAVTLLARDRKGPKIGFQLLIYPVTDLASDNESKRLYSKGYLLNSMPFYINSYVRAEADKQNGLASPLRAADLSNLPPAFILTAGFDPLRDEGEAYAERLRQAGVAVTLKRYESMIHGFVSITGLLPSAEAGLVDSAAALRDAFRS
ncbi:MAG: alpha/beta hydrolase [Alphaproteobacteria bacterium]